MGESVMDSGDEVARRRPVQREHFLQVAIKQFTRDAIDLSPDQFVFMSFDAALNATMNQRVRAVARGEIQGRPDTLLCVKGHRPLWAELKTATGRVSPAQEQMLERLRGIHHAAEVIRTVYDYWDYLQGYSIPLRRNAELIAQDLDLKVAARIAKAEERSRNPVKSSHKAQPRYLVPKRIARSMNTRRMG